jgi:hypothetical protein
MSGNKSKDSVRLQIEYYSPRELRPSAHNAKVHTKQQINQIVKSIERFGFELSPNLGDGRGQAAAV